MGMLLLSSPNYIVIILRGEDVNVPVWHTREAVGLLKSLYPSQEIMLVVLFVVVGLMHSNSDFFQLQGRWRRRTLVSKHF